MKVHFIALPNPISLIFLPKKKKKSFGRKVQKQVPYELEDFLLGWNHCPGHVK